MSIKSEIHLSLLSMEQEFEEYLKRKKIDPEGFLKNEPDTFNEFKYIFPTMHPKSFTMQKLFLINILRRKYHYSSNDNVKTAAKPQIKPVLSKPVPTTGEVSDKNPVIKPTVRPKRSKPLIGQKKTDNDEALKQSKKPVIRPKIKPVVDSEDSKTQVGVSKPKLKMQRPVIKPKVKPEPEKEENTNGINSNRKKPVKPIIKPKFQKPNKED